MKKRSIGRVCEHFGEIFAKDWLENRLIEASDLHKPGISGFIVCMN